MIEVVVKSIAIDSITGSPILLLADVNNPEDIYPIWIGVAEAEGIVVNQSGFVPPRPLTYDLFKNTIESLGGTVKYVSIVNMVNNAYIAELVIDQDGKEIVIDARPSDAINLALRFNAPIYLNEEVVKKVNVSQFTQQQKKDEEKEEDEIKTVEELAQQTEVNNLNLPDTKEVGIKEEDLEKFREMLDNIKPEDFLIK
ncbi:bifunctional nuclease family protein [Sulfurihydrogenibium azorense]|uniref:bifunctional nuclease family protein n=1 Tax=Sulfurihydrogenibium azorense TaxID=309806 RepID=UPI002409B17A|nr:bifunctional nuclease family protein [Sulfurihydrogenibium azorense]MDM7272960.1 bifunctional nuclease family protein [Sulfurihydrogenibium azorense]